MWTVWLYWAVCLCGEIKVEMLLWDLLYISACSSQTVWTLFAVSVFFPWALTVCLSTFSTEKGRSPFWSWGLSSPSVFTPSWVIISCVSSQFILSFHVSVPPSCSRGVMTQGKVFISLHTFTTVTCCCESAAGGFPLSDSQSAPLEATHAASQAFLQTFLRDFQRLFSLDSLFPDLFPDQQFNSSFSLIQ